MEKLKVVIVDDEERICQLIQALINWEEMGLQVEGMAHNGIDACEVVRKVRPDILIPDIRMPGCSGLELIEKVKKTCPELEIIVISGYAHFEYAQQAIKFGVGHYLLKPINRAELTETLEKLKQRIRERRESERDKEVLIQKAQKNESHMRSEFVLALFDGNVEKDMGNVLPEILEETYHIYLKPGILQAFCLKMDCEERALGNSSVDVLMEKAKEILERNLKDKCLEMAMELRDFYCFGFVNYESRYQEEIRRVLKNSLSQIEVQKAIFGQVDFSMALGSPGREIEDLYHSARETQKLICQRLVKGSGRLLEHMGEESSMQGEKMLDRYLREITQAAETLSAEQAQQAVEHLLEKVRTIRNPRGCEIQELVSCAADIFGACVQIQERSTKLEKFRQQCEQCSSAEKLFECLDRFQREQIEEILQSRENERVRPVRKAKEYIQSHYGEPLTLEEVSEKVGLSPNYFSVLFKKTQGEGFARYLINVRIEQAKILLRETNYPVVEICRKVGYNDLKHFTQTFEKITEIKPSTYRKLYG